MRTLVDQIKCSQTIYNLQDRMLVQIKQDTSSKEPSYTVGSTILPWKSNIPVWRSLRKKRNGWSAMNWNSLMRGLRLRYPLILTAVTAAAVVPCSSTSIIAFWITWVWTQWKLLLESKIAIPQKTRSSWLNCALRDDEAVYWVSIGHYEAVAVGNWWYWVSRGHSCLYILQKVGIWKGVTHAWLTHKGKIELLSSL